MKKTFKFGILSCLPLIISLGASLSFAAEGEDALSAFKSSLRKGCMQQGAANGQSAEISEKTCGCVIETLERELNADQLAEFAHGIALNKKKMKSFNLDDVQAKLAACGR